MYKSILFTLLFVCYFSSSFSQKKVSGGLSATSILYNAKGIKDRKDPFSYILSGNVNVPFFGSSLPFSFLINNHSNQFGQPFNRFGFSPKYKWATLHLGYRNIKFDPLVFNGHQVLGAGIELNPGKIRFGAIAGKFRGDLNLAKKVDEINIDSLGQFTRKGFAVKMGVGTNQSFFDIVFLKVTDELPTLPVSLDSIKPPSANTAIGFNTKISFTPKLSFTMNAAYSIYTTNLYSKSIDLGESFIFDVLPPLNLSTEHYYAIKSAVSYKPAKNLSFAVKYRRIEPGFKSMGLYFLQSDEENITLNTSLSLWKNKIKMSGSFGTQRNNLNGIRGTTSQRNIGSANLNFNPNKNFGLSANFANFSINQHGDVVQIADSVKLYQTNNQLSVVPRYIIYGKKVNHVIMLMYNTSSLNDKNPYTNKFTEFVLTNYMVTYNANIIPINLSLSAGYTHSLVHMALSDNTNNSISLGLSKNLMDRRLHLRFNQLITSSSNNNKTTILMRPAISVSYDINKHHHFKLHFIYKNNKSETKLFSETIADISYNFTF